MSVRAPVLAQHFQSTLRQRHVPILGSLTVSHVNGHAVTVNVSDLQVNPFSHAQPAGVDRAQAYPIALVV